MGYPSYGFTFEKLRDANKDRQAEWPGDDKTTTLFRAIEVFGEAGELAEAIKKYERANLGIAGTTADMSAIRDEIGDVLISLDLLASHLDIDLGTAVRDKFNKTSDKYDFKTRL